MSQTVTYKTEYKNLNDIKKVIDELISKGVFGKNAKVIVKGQPGFDTGVYYHYTPEKKDNIIFRIKDGGDNYFTKGFYDKGFAIARDAQGNIELVFDYNSGRDEDTNKVTENIKKNIDDMIKVGTDFIDTQKAVGDILDNMQANKTSETSYEIEGTIPEHVLKSILGL